MIPRRLKSRVEKSIYNNDNISILVPTKTHGGFTNLYIGNSGEYALIDMSVMDTNPSWLCQLRPQCIFFNKPRFQITFDDNRIHISPI
jgi:hypothetical protein